MLSAPALIAAVRAAKEPTGAITSGLSVMLIVLKKKACEVKGDAG